MKDSNGENHYSVNPFENVEGVSRMEQCAIDCGVELSKVLDIAEWLEKNDPRPAFSEEQVNAARLVTGKHRQAFHFLVEYQSGQNRIKEARMSTRAMAMVLGHDTAAGASNPTDLARIMKFKKQTVHKCAALFQKRLEMPENEGQWSEEAKKELSDSAKKRVKAQKSYDE